MPNQPTVAAPEDQDQATAVRVVVPCLNEAGAIADVVRAFRQQPNVVEVLVVDNGSSDQTVEIARAAGARVIRESRPGKGFAVITGLREAGSADYYVMVDGDDTYSAAALSTLLRAAQQGSDMVIGTRLESADAGAFRAGHGFGNRLFITLVRIFFRLKTTDLFSGYRILSQRFVDVVPLIAHGFEIELELSLQAFTNSFRVTEVPTAYRPRSKGDQSKLRTFRDGVRILKSLILFFRDYRPIAFFGALSVILLTFSLGAGSVVVRQYLETGLVLRLPLAVLAAALFVLSALSLTCGTILSSVNRRAAELTNLVATLRHRTRDR